MFPNPSCHLTSEYVTWLHCSFYEMLVHTSRYLLAFCSKMFVDALQRAGAQATLILFEGKTHTDLFLQVSDVSDIFLYGCYYYSIW